MRLFPKLVFAAMVLSLYTISVPNAQAQYDSKAEGILNLVSKKYEAIKSYKAEFVYELENQQAKVKEKFSGIINVKGQKFTINLGNQEIINNGTTVWTYLKDQNEVNISDYTPDEDQINPAKIYVIYKSGFKYVFSETEKIKGVAFDVIDLVPENKNKPYFKIRLWINQKDKTLSKCRIFEKNGNRYLYTISNFVPNPKLEDTMFSFDKTKYKGVEEIDLR